MLVTPPINILIIDPSRDDAEIRISMLRNAGLAVHAKRADKERDLVKLLSKAAFDIVLYACADKNIALSTACEICAQTKQDLPFIVLHQKDITKERDITDNSGIRSFIPQGDPQCLLRVVKRELNDLRARRQLSDLKRQLQESEQRCASLIENSQNAIAYIHEGMHIGANSAYLGMFGNLDVDDIEGLPILNMIAPDDHKMFKSFLRKQPTRRGVSELDIKCQSNAGDIFDAKMEFSNASIDNESCMQIIIRDQSKQIELEEKIELLSLQDSQTGLHNRLFFLKKLKQALEACQSSDDPCYLLYISVDRFRAIRNSVGITVGDTLLKTIAEILGKTVGENEILARFDDHSFIILTQCVENAGAEEIAGRICTALDEQFTEPSEYGVNPTCSIGIAYSKSGILSQDFIDHAYFACEIARAHGGNQFTIYDPNAILPGYEDNKLQGSLEKEHIDREQEDIKEDKAPRVVDTERQLEDALKNDRVRLVYQPVVSLQGDSRENYAVMVRLLDDGKEINISSVFGNAESAELMVDLDRWVVKHAIQELTQQRNDGRKINFFITMSKSSIVNPSTLLMICDSLREAQAKGAWLTFQIREADLRAHTQEAKDLINGLKKIKCQIAVTHFGLVSKPEAILKRLPIDFVKLDVSFVENLSAKPEKQKKLTEINALIQDHGIKTIATAVEDANNLAVLWTVGVNYIQGYFLQEPSDTIAFNFPS